LKELKSEKLKRWREYIGELFEDFRSDIGVESKEIGS
jgi:hypothetical protein